MPFFDPRVDFVSMQISISKATPLGSRDTLHTVPNCMHVVAVVDTCLRVVYACLYVGSQPASLLAVSGRRIGGLRYDM